MYRVYSHTPGKPVILASIFTELTVRTTVGYIFVPNIPGLRRYCEQLSLPIRNRGTVPEGELLANDRIQRGENMSVTEERYPKESLDPNDDDGTMPQNVEELEKALVGHKIVAAYYGEATPEHSWRSPRAMIILLDDGTQVELFDTDDCCAHTTLESFLLNADKIDHLIMGVGTTDEYNTWHIFADFGDVMEMKVGWSCGNPFYYGYGFDIRVKKPGPVAKVA